MVVDGAPLINETNSLRGENLKDKIRVAQTNEPEMLKRP